MTTIGSTQQLTGVAGSMKLNCYSHNKQSKDRRYEFLLPERFKTLASMMTKLQPLDKYFDEGNGKTLQIHGA